MIDLDKVKWRHIQTDPPKKYYDGFFETVLLKTYEGASTPDAVNWGWSGRTRDAEVFGRGNVKHADHATIFLDGWHKVIMNTESGATSRSNMFFLD